MLSVSTEHLTDCILKQNDGKTALHIASINGDENLIKVLFVLKADPNIPDKQDRTPLHIATERGETGIVELLADKFKASVHERTKVNWHLLVRQTLRNGRQTDSQRILGSFRAVEG